MGRTLQAALDEQCRRWDRDGLVGRLWRKDAAVWTGGDEARWLGWLDLPGAPAPAAALARFAAGVRADGFTDVLLLGMGGSSLGAEVIGDIVAPPAGAPALHVLDSTHPAQIARTASRLDLSRTLCIVSSKSGTTLESALLADWFLERMRRAVGPDRAGAHFAAITDPGSALEETAGARGFRQVWSGRPDVGGRFSVLSSFGLVPAAACGVDVPAFLASAGRMAGRCGPDVPADGNPGVRLGLALGAAAAAGRDKTTLVLPPSIRALGGWLEQLLAESTGKAGRGVIPVVDEDPGPPAAYGGDRLFVHMRVADDPEPRQDAALAALADAGHPVVVLSVPGRDALAGELFRWELATAVCGAVLGVNPFDQPDVEAAKQAARARTSAWEGAGGPAEEHPVARADGIALFADAKTIAHLQAAAGEPAAVAGADTVAHRAASPGGPAAFAGAETTARPASVAGVAAFAGAGTTARPASAAGGPAAFAGADTAGKRGAAGGRAALEWLVAAHLASAGPGDYVALLAYLDRNETHTAVLQRVRSRIRDARGVATSVGFGPRYLHSTGQLFKGGPATGVFLVLTADDGDDDLPIPGRPCTFGAVKTAQALGDVEVLAARRRRVLRLHLEGGAAAGLPRFESLIGDALGRAATESRKR